jgi:hypothetical protein
MKLRTLFAVPVAAALITTSAFAFDASSGRKAQEKGTAQIPVCGKRLGTIAVVEPDNNWWAAQNLGSPEAIIKVFVMKSGCFGLVDRGKGLASRNIERALADSGELQAGSNIGKRQVKAADYFVVPDLVTKNANSGGNALGGLVGGMLGGRTFGALAGGINIKKKEANVTLTLVNARTTEQELLTEGYARKSDLSFGAGAGAGSFFGGGFGGVGGGGYQDTDIGQVIVLAYLDAYTKMVTQMGGLPTNPSAAAPKAQ